MSRTVGSLFSGIGGLDLGLERAGWTVRWQSEIDPYCSRVLAKHWPDVPNLGDVKSVDWSQVERTDLICGGYPCQPFSLAGSRRGTDDERHLWPFMRDAIGVLRPRLALLENVPGHLSMGFGDVLGDLAALGYDTEWDCIPAAAIGAPHLRYRVFIVAYADGDGYGEQQGTRRMGRVDRGDESEARERERAQFGDRSEALADADGTGLEGQGRSRLREPIGRVTASGGGTDADANRGRQQDGPQLDGEAPQAATVWPSRRRHANGLRDEMADATCSGRHERRDGNRESTRLLSLSTGGSDSLRRYGEQWAVEPDVGRVAYGVPSRVDRLRALGNAVVPQVAEFIGRHLLAAL